MTGKLEMSISYENQPFALTLSVFFPPSTISELFNYLDSVESATTGDDDSDCLSPDLKIGHRSSSSIGTVTATGKGSGKKTRAQSLSELAREPPIKLAERIVKYRQGLELVKYCQFHESASLFRHPDLVKTSSLVRLTF